MFPWAEMAEAASNAARAVDRRDLYISLGFF